MNVKMTKEELKEIIRRVLNYYLQKRDRSESEDSRTLFLIPKYAVNLKDLLAEYELYGELDNIDFLLEAPTEEFESLPRKRVFYGEYQKDIGKVLGNIEAYQKVELYDPSISLLQSLKSGQERCLFTRILMYFLSTGKPTVVRLPYDKGNVPGGSFGKETRDLIDALWDMGVSFAGLTPNFEEFAQLENKQKQDLITQEIVEEYASKGYKEIYAAEGAVITPLALERAKELDIQIIK